MLAERLTVTPTISEQVRAAALPARGLPSGEGIAKPTVGTGRGTEGRTERSSSVSPSAAYCNSVCASPTLTSDDTETLRVKSAPKRNDVCGDPTYCIAAASFVQCALGCYKVSSRELVSGGDASPLARPPQHEAERGGERRA